MKTNKLWNQFAMFMLVLGTTVVLLSCNKDDEEKSGESNYESTGKAPSSVKAIDLGLSVKWASCNIGATKPEEYGNYYAWAETETKVRYDWTTYKYCSTSRYMTKYSINYGIKDGKTSIELDDDVAHVKWGGNWRIPTRNEMDELKFKCEWTWATKNGVNGYEVKSKINNNTIFLPASGMMWDDHTGSVGSCGFYWSSSLSKDRSYYSCILTFDSDSDRVLLEEEGYQRSDGVSVRAVCK